MNKRYFNGIRAIVLSALVGLVSFAYADVAYNEQIIPANGGKSVSMDGEWAAVGAYDVADNSSCYITMYKLDYVTMTWKWHSELFGSDRLVGKINSNCSTNNGFGAAVSLSGSEMVVGLADSGKSGAFSAYSYNSVLNRWVLSLDSVRATDAQNDSGFGTEVRIQKGILLVGAPRYNGAAGTDTGKIYLYKWPPNFSSGLMQTPIVTVEGSQAGSLFGSALGGDSEKIFVGAPGYDQRDLNLSDNGAGFMYKYNASAESLTPAGVVYGTTDNERLGLKLQYTGALAVIASDKKPYGYRFNGSEWELDYTLEEASGGVDIVDNIGAIAKKGDSINIYPLLDRHLNSYYFEIVPSGTYGNKFAEDISLYQNHLAVSEFDQKQTRFYTMPCGYGGKLVENEWAMVSIPCKITDETVDSIFGDDGLGDYGKNWLVYEQNSSNYSGKSSDYVKMKLNSAVEQGKSYWIISDTSNTWKVDSTASLKQTDLSTTIVPVLDMVAGTYAITLPKADQNVSGDIFAKVMVGNPFARSFEWTNVQYYSVLSGAITPLADLGEGYIANSTAYAYDSSITSGQPYIAVTQTPGVGSKKIPVNEGFWIKILKNVQTGDKLLIPLEK